MSFPEIRKQFYGFLPSVLQRSVSELGFRKTLTILSTCGVKAAVYSMSREPAPEIEAFWLELDSS